MMASLEAAPITFQIVTAVSSGVAVAVIVVLWITREFSKTRALFFRVISRHNREDDDRFAHLDTEVWKLHLRNARKDGTSPPERTAMRRRRYLMDDTGDEEGTSSESESVGR
jgi:hypothetical protein